MFENEDVILPDDYQEAPPQAQEPSTEEVTDDFEPTPQEQPTDLAEDTKPAGEETQPVTEPQKIKVKYNHEEQEIDYDEAVPLIQKGMNYDKALERAKQEARDAVIAEQGYEWNGKQITTEAEYKQALQEKELIEKYKDLPEELVQEILDNRRFRDEYEADKQAKTEEEKSNQEFQEFFDYFKQANGRDYNPAKDQIPPEVWEANKNGTPLKYAFMEHHNNQLKSQLQTKKQNEENALKSPVGSLSSHGSTEVAEEDDFMRGFNSI